MPVNTSRQLTEREEPIIKNRAEIQFKLFQKLSNLKF